MLQGGAEATFARILARFCCHGILLRKCVAVEQVVSTLDTWHAPPASRTVGVLQRCLEGRLLNSDYVQHVGGESPATMSGYLERSSLHRT